MHSHFLQDFLIKQREEQSDGFHQDDAIVTCLVAGQWDPAPARGRVPLGRSVCPASRATAWWECVLALCAGIHSWRAACKTLSTNGSVARAASISKQSKGSVFAHEIRGSFILVTGCVAALLWSLWIQWSTSTNDVLFCSWFFIQTQFIGLITSISVVLGYIKVCRVTGSFSYSDCFLKFLCKRLGRQSNVRGEKESD